MYDRWATRYLLLLASVVALYSGSLLQPRTVVLRDRYKLVSRPAKTGVPPEYILTSSLLGGFRGIFITALWIRAQEMKNDGKFYEMVDIYGLITKLQPNFHMAWAFQAWDLTYNVSVEFDDVKDRSFWVFSGVDMLRHEAIPRNSNLPDLYRELAWFFYHKIGGDLDYGHPEYRRLLAHQMERILRGIHAEQYEMLGEVASLRREYETREEFRQSKRFSPAIQQLREAGYDPFEDFSTVLSRETDEQRILLENEDVGAVLRAAVLWTIGEDLKEQVNMDPQEMYHLCVRYGPIDWRSPYAHSLYWASLGYRTWKSRSGNELTMTHERLVYFSLISLVKRGRIVYGDGGYVHYLPDYRLIDGVIAHMDEAIEYFDTRTRLDGTKVSLTGIKSGYFNFLRDAVFLAYFGNEEQRAARLLNKLAAESGDPRFQVSLREFVIAEFPEWIDAPNIERANAVISQWLSSAYQSLAAGDMDGYERANSLLEFLYKSYVTKRWDPNSRQNPNDSDYRNHVPPLAVVRFNMAMDLLVSPRSSMPRWMRANLYAGLRQYEPETFRRVEAEMQKIREASPQPAN